MSVSMKLFDEIGVDILVNNVKSSSCNKTASQPCVYTIRKTIKSRWDFTKYLPIYCTKGRDNHRSNDERPGGMNGRSDVFKSRFRLREEDLVNNAKKIAPQAIFSSR